MYRTLPLKHSFSLLGVLLLTVTLLTTGASTSNAFSSDKGFAEVVKKAKPAVVHIRVEKSVAANSYDQQYEEFFNNPFFERFFGPQFRQQHPQQNPQRSPRREYKQQGQGSGFIISKDGYILTNNHVVEEADTITVILSDEQEFKAELIGRDPQSDVALIKIKDKAQLPVLALGDSDALEVGEWVIAIGNPFGLSQTVTAGVVSATGRSSVGINEYENFIQTDAAINPGNSGGPLLNINGEVVGINSALYSRTGGYMGIGFAIPINMVKNIEEQLKNAGKVTRGWLGVVIQNVDENLARSFGLDKAEGILVSEVQPGSPADKSGVKQGDVIVRLNGTTLKDVADLRNRVALMSPDSSAKLDVIRNGKDVSVQVNIGERPNDISQSSTDTPEGSGSALEQFGLTFQNLTPELAERLGYDDKQGVVISQVEPGSPASSAGLMPGQLIEEVNKKAVHNVKELKQAMEKSDDQKRLLLRVRSGNFSQYVVLIAK
ncbi:DegQ family serine endoprotease [Desulfopila aestuarii]|uniref:Probable periplasmic serine endoprotease DegP-like n=1 Tax=Desulfopila aestuarii DSM 18488 TaxID=1121416 RepID=A0A1M7XWP3_9BACT|nr:DegQ family serine endoprotease [Desulfopila aestuarii]SHO43033.1 serine protease Do [Desulfopila aestuarii DSM 18488]